MANHNRRPIPEMSALALDDDKIVVREDFNACLAYGGLDDDAVLRL